MFASMSRRTPLMLRVEAEHPGVKVFRLPFLGSAEVQRHIELGVRDLPEQVPAAMQMLRRGVAELDYAFDEKPAVRPPAPSD